MVIALKRGLVVAALVLGGGVFAENTEREYRARAQGILMRLESISDRELKAMAAETGRETIAALTDVFDFIDAIGLETELPESAQTEMINEVTDAGASLVVRLCEHFDDMVLRLISPADLMRQGDPAWKAYPKALAYAVGHILSGFVLRDIPSMTRSLPGPFDLRDDRRTNTTRRFGAELRRRVADQYSAIADDKSEKTENVLAMAAYGRFLSKLTAAEPVRYGETHKWVRRFFIGIILKTVLWGPFFEYTFTRTRTSPFWKGVLVEAIVAGYFAWLRTANSGLPMYNQLFARSWLVPWRSPALSYYHSEKTRTALLDGEKSKQCNAILDGFSIGSALREWMERFGRMTRSRRD